MSYWSLTADLTRRVRDGEKTVTRRPLRTLRGARSVSLARREGDRWHLRMTSGLERNLSADELAERCPLGRVGERRWIREPARVVRVWRHTTDRTLIEVEYLADNARRVVYHPHRLRPVHPGQGLPNGVHREGARTWVEVVSVGAGFADEVDDLDARAEGFASAEDFAARWREFYAHTRHAVWILGFRFLSLHDAGSSVNLNNEGSSRGIPEPASSAGT